MQLMAVVLNLVVILLLGAEQLSCFFFLSPGWHPACSQWPSSWAICTVMCWCACFCCWFTLVGIVASFISTFFAHAFLTLAQQVRGTLCNQWRFVPSRFAVFLAAGR